MSKEWGVRAFVYRYPTNKFGALGDWSLVARTASLHPPVQMVDLPGWYEYWFGDLRFSRNGAWYFEYDGSADNGGAVYYAPFSTGVFHHVTTVVITPDSPAGAIAYPDGIVIYDEASARVWVVDETQGVVLDSVLPETPLGGAYENEAGHTRVPRPYAVCWVPQEGGPDLMGLVVAAPADLPGDEAVAVDGYLTDEVMGSVFLSLTPPGGALTVHSGVVVTPRMGRAEARPIAGLAAGVYEVGTVLCYGENGIYKSAQGGVCTEYRYWDSEEQIH